MRPPPTPGFKLLGPLIATDGPRQEWLPDERPTHLLVLLALAPGWVSRSGAAERLWPRLEHEAGLRNLRKTLHRVRRLWWGSAVVVEAQRMRLCAQTDLAECLQHLEAGAPTRALELLQGPLAQDLGRVADGEPVDWLDQAREQWLGRWRSALFAALPALPPIQAENELQRLRRWDPHDEDLTRAHLMLLADAGRRAEAERVRSDYAKAMSDDLGVDLPPSLQRGPETWPDGASPALIGREDELAQIGSIVSQPGAAVSLIGVGGVGKTRLAAELAARARSEGLEIVWLRLSDLTRLPQVWPTLAVALGVDLRPETDPLATLASALSRRPALLVVDNCEHLLEGGEFVRRLEALRAAAPSLRVLTTSRESPGWTAARELVLRGLESPEPVDPPGAVLRSPAVRLFLARAQRLDSTLEPRAEAGALGRIARAVDGHPLALELAASWVRSQGCADIAAELEAGRLPDASGGRDLARLFERTWTLLAPRLQACLATLASLPGSFRRASALEIAGMRAAEFAALVDKCLIDRIGERWRLHPLLATWLNATWPPDAEVGGRLARRAADHFVAHLAALQRDQGRDGRATLEWIDAELPHLLAAWRSAATAGRLDHLEPLVAGLEAHHEIRGRRDEALALIQDAVTRLPATPDAKAARLRLDGARASLLFRAGRYDEAHDLAREVGRAARARRAWRSLAAARRVQGLVQWQRGRPDDALRLFRETHALAEREGLLDLLPFALLNIAIIDQFQGQDERAERGYRQVAEQTRRGGSMYVHANALINLGSLLHSVGRAAEARPVLEEALNLVDAEQMLSFRTHTLTNLGATLLHLGELDALAPVLTQARQAADHGGDASAMYSVELLGLMACLRGDRLREGWQHALGALAVTTRMGQKPAQGAVAMYCAQLWAAAGQRARAATWLAFQLQWPQLWDVDRREAQRLWDELGLDPAEQAIARDAAASVTLDDLRRAVASEAAA